MAIPVHLVGEGVDWPDWIQAVGSVLAIFVALFVVYWEGARSRRSAKEQARQLREKALVLARAFATAFEMAAIAHGVMDLPDYYAPEEIGDASVELSLGVLAGALADFPAEALETAAAMSAMLRLAGIAEIAVQNFRLLIDLPHEDRRHDSVTRAIRTAVDLAAGHNYELSRLLAQPSK